MTARVEVGEGFTIVVPPEVRDQLGIQPGDGLLLEVCDGELRVRPERSNYTARLRGLHREVWAGVDPDEYVQREREAWSQT